MRVVAVIFGVLLLLPGLCFLGFGGTFTLSGVQYPQSGLAIIGLVEVLIGGLITWGAVLMIINYSKPRQPPKPPENRE